MRNVSTKWIGLGGFIAMTVAFSMAGCAGTKEDTVNPGVGGTGAGGASNVSGSPAVGGGSAAQGGASATTTVPLPDGVTCGPSDAAAAPGNPLLTDFGAASKVTAGVYNGTNFTWGDSTKTLTGGTFFYDGDDDNNVAVLTVTVADEKANITGTIPTSKYAGFGLWFGPCTDARAYQGIAFSISGDMGNSELQIQVQTSRNYPVADDGTKGECVGEWDKECVSNNKVLTGLVLTADPQTIQLPWADLVGGAPITPIEPAELLGFQWHFNCGDAGECLPNVIIDDVTFY